MTTSWTAAKSEADVFEQRPQPARSVGVALRQHGCLLNEGLAWAFWLVAAKPPDPQIDNSPPTGDRQIAKITLVTAVERFRPGAAMRAVCAGRFTADREVHDLVPQPYLLDNEPGAWRQQQLWIQVHLVGGPAIRQAGVFYRLGPGPCNPRPANLDIPSNATVPTWTTARSQMRACPYSLATSTRLAHFPGIA